MAARRCFHAAPGTLIIQRLLTMHDEKHDEQITEIEKLTAPYGKEIVIQDVAYENGMHVMRVRIREGRRFTIFDLDVNTASKLKDVFGDWIKDEGQ